jgi:hypothetical protein
MPHRYRGLLPTTLVEEGHPVKDETHDAPHVQVRELDVGGVGVQGIYPTLGLTLSGPRGAALAVDPARAYNDWLADFYAAEDAIDEAIPGVR